MKKQIGLLFFFLLPVFVYAQRTDSTKYAGEKNPWIEILDLDEENVETIETATTDYLVEGTESKLFVFTASGEVFFFKLFTPKGRGKRKIKEEELSATQQSYYKKMLADCRTNNFNNIQANQLNIIAKDNIELTVTQGETFRLRYIGYDYYKDFYTYAPLKYIEQKFPGWQEREKLLNLIVAFNQEVMK